MELDSLGQVIKRKKGAAGRAEALSFKIRDNCYVLFCTGIILDHTFSCYSLGPPVMLRNCTAFNDYPDGPWPFDLGTIIGMLGDTKCQLGMLLLGGIVLLFGVYQLSTGHVEKDTGHIHELGEEILPGDHPSVQNRTRAGTRLSLARISQASLLRWLAHQTGGTSGGRLDDPAGFAAAVSGAGLSPSEPIRALPSDP